MVEPPSSHSLSLLKFLQYSLPSLFVPRDMMSHVLHCGVSVSAHERPADKSCSLFGDPKLISFTKQHWAEL